MSAEIKAKFEAAKKHLEAAQAELRSILDTMILLGMAKKVEDGYGSGYQVTVVASPGLLSRIDTFIWEDDLGLEFRNDNETDPIKWAKGELEWF
jgi:hypothetical protein